MLPYGCWQRPVRHDPWRGRRQDRYTSGLSTSARDGYSRSGYTSSRKETTYPRGWQGCLSSLSPLRDTVWTVPIRCRTRSCHTSVIPVPLALYTLDALYVYSVVCAVYTYVTNMFIALLVLIVLFGSIQSCPKNKTKKRDKWVPKNPIIFKNGECRHPVKGNGYLFWGKTGT